MPTRKKPQGKAQENDIREKFWRTARKAAAQVPFMDEVVAGYYCAMDKQTPLKSKGILLAALAYFVLPADAVPDIFFGIGFTDDFAVLAAALASVRAQIKPAHRLAAREALEMQS